MRHGSKALVFAALIAGMSGGVSIADEERGTRLFSLLDADGNDVLTKAELDGFAQRRFDRADADGNGTLSLEEIEAEALRRVARRSKARLTRLDANGDGLVQWAEFAQSRSQRSARIFDRADANGDGKVTREEMLTARPRPRTTE